MNVVEERAHGRGRIGIASTEMLRRDGEAKVLGDGHVREQRRMLVDDRDAELLRDRRRQLTDWRAVEGHRAAVGCRRARSDVHQCRLPGAVLPEKGMHLTGEHVEGDVGERRDRVVVLADATHRQRRTLRGRSLPKMLADDVDHDEGPSVAGGVRGGIASAHTSGRWTYLTSFACATAGNWAER